MAFLMDAQSIILILSLAVLLLLSAFFSASETSYSAMNHIRLKQLAADGNKKAARALKLAQQYDKLLSSILIGNNIVNIAASSLATVLFVAYLGNLGVTVSTIVMTVLVLVFGEISPKTLAKEAPERFAMFAAPILTGLLIVFTPFTAFFSGWKKLLLKLFRINPNKNTVTEQELLSYVEEARQGGGINENEETMLRSAIEFDDVQAIEIATPRVDISAISVEDESWEIAQQFHETGYSRLPVYRDSIDDITGVILEKDFNYYVQSLNQSLSTVIRPILFITKSVKISNLLKELQNKKIHMAVILDEYGGTVGLVTIEDIIEELVGEIWDEHDQVRQDIQQLADGRYRILGGTDLDEMFELFDMSDEDATSQTAAGWAMEKLGRIPKRGDNFEANGLQVLVSDMRKNRIESLIVQKLSPAADLTEGDA